MTHDRFTDLLSGYLDGELAGPERRNLEIHLEGCASCRRILADLKAILAAAPYYEGRAPGRDLWPALTQYLKTESKVIPLQRRSPGPIEDAAALLHPPRRRGHGWPLLLAAGLLIALVSGGTVWVATHGTRADSSLGPAIGVAPGSASRTAAFTDRQYESAVADLERIFAEGRERLDTSTVRVLEESLRKIDTAIAEARAALARDSSNVFLGRQLAGHLRRKLNLLRTVTGALART